jgi:hypothetical protein
MRTDTNAKALRALGRYKHQQPYDALAIVPPPHTAGYIYMLHTHIGAIAPCACLDAGCDDFVACVAHVL